MSVSGIGSYNSFTASALAGGASGRSAPGAAAAAANATSASSSSASNTALQWLTNYLKETPAKRMVDAWLAQHKLTEQEVAAMPPAKQQAVYKQMAADIKKKLQEQAGGAPAGAADIVV